MAYNLQRKGPTPFVGGKNILASEHLQFKEGGATIAGGQGALEVGTLIAQRADGLFEVFNATTHGTTPYVDFGILNVDADATEHNAVVGEVIVRGSVYELKLPTNAGLDAFKAEVPMIRFVK